MDAVYADAQDAAKKTVEDDEDYATSQTSDVADQEDDNVEAESEDASAERQKILTEQQCEDLTKENQKLNNDILDLEAKVGELEIASQSAFCVLLEAEEEEKS